MRRFKAVTFLNLSLANHRKAYDGFKLRYRHHAGKDEFYSHGGRLVLVGGDVVAVSGWNRVMFRNAIAKANEPKPQTLQAIAS